MVLGIASFSVLQAGKMLRDRQNAVLVYVHPVERRAFRGTGTLQNNARHVHTGHLDSPGEPEHRYSEVV